MKKWHTEGIPLAIVLEAMETCFVKRNEAGRKRSISSLSYCKHAVDDLWTERRDLYVGKSDAVPEADPRAQSEMLIEELELAAAASPSEVAQLLRGAGTRVREGSRGSVPQIEEALMKIEAELFEQLAAVISDEDRRAIEATLAAQTEGMEGAAADRARSANRKRLLRNRFRIPRLSLFR